MQNFDGRIAVITGAGSGIGRALAMRLSAEGCHVALGDVSQDGMDVTRERCIAAAPTGTRVSVHLCDVADEEQVRAFRDAVLAEHDTEHVNLVFNNAGIGGGGSFVHDARTEWERTFNVCWYGVYYGARAFLPALLASDAGYLVNTSSVNGFWASLGPQTPHTAYSAAKFAVKGFSEALLTDLRLNAPHVKVAVVMPGHIGTSIITNSARVLGRGDPATMSSDKAPTTAEQAADIIVDGVRAGRWRILVGDDAQRLDERVRADPEGAYEADFAQRTRERGDLRELIRQGEAGKRS